MKLFGFEKEHVKEAIRIAWPAVLESFFIALVAMIDSYMVSELGAESVAAVGLTTQPKMVALSIFFAGNVSISALVARRKGQEKRREANEIFATFLLMNIILAVLSGILFVCLADPFIAFCGSKPDTHDLAVSYYRIIMGGMLFNCLQMGINAAQRGAGNTKITMRTNLTSNLVNIFFNYLLISGNLGFPALGIRGAAIATVLGSVVACVMSICSVCKKDNFVSIIYILREKVAPGFAALKNIVSVGYSIFAEQLLIRVGFMATAMMAAQQGTQAMAANQVAMNVMHLSFSFGDGLQATAVALIGHSLGAKKPELAKEYGRICRAIGGMISVVLAVLYFTGGRWLFSLYFKEESIVRIGTYIMYIIALIVTLQISQVIYMGCLRGAGDTLYTAIVSTVSIAIVRTCSAYFFCYICNWGIIGIWFGVVADQSARLILASTRFRKGKWTQIHI